MPLYWAILLFSLLCWLPGQGAWGTTPLPKKICLNMIVKDESPVIERCLNSVKPWIDYWVIVDTGSTDGTQAKIRKCLQDIPGELYERPWVNFGYNRNEALTLAKGKGDYLLFIDADEILEGCCDKRFLEQDAYLAICRTSRDPMSPTFQRALLINNHQSWSWHGVLHESLRYPGKRITELLSGVVIGAEARDGHRSCDPQKYLKDAHTLEQALLKEPDNSEYVYYLAQSYRSANELALALKNYQKRAHMEGWDQQTFCAKYYLAQLQELLHMDSTLVIQSYCDAFLYRPTRAEPLYSLAYFFYQRKNYLLAYLIAQLGRTIGPSEDIVQVDHWIYSYGLEAIYANCALEMGKKEEAKSSYEKIAQKKDIPTGIREEALATLKFLSISEKGSD